MSTFAALEKPRVLYEDNHLLAIFKPSGWQTQPSDSQSPDAFSWVKADLKERYAKPGNVFVGIVHRLDQPVCGVLLFARTSKAASRLSESIRTHVVEKKYLAWVENRDAAREFVEGRWTAYLSEDAAPSVVVSDEPFENGKIAHMQVSILERHNRRLLIEIHLETGRKHQIRAMLGARGYPILDDRRYDGGRRSDWKGEIALLAHSLSFPHPTRQERVTIRTETSDWIKKWRDRP